MFLDNFLHGIGSLGMGRKGPRGSDGISGIADKLYDQLSALLLRGISGVLHIVSTDIQADTDLTINVANDADIQAAGDIKIYSSKSTGNPVDIGSHSGIVVHADSQVGIIGLQGVSLYTPKTGATQVAAGAITFELWITQGHASLPNGVLMVGL